MYVECIDEDSSIIRKLFREIDYLVIIKKIYISSAICTQELLLVFYSAQCIHSKP